MFNTTRLKSAILVAALAAAPLSAGANEFEAQVKARQGQMRLIALNLGVLAGMAKGTVDFDAASAQETADNLVALASVGPALTWPEGSMEGTAAKESVWTNSDDFLSKWNDMAPAAAALAAVASTDAASIGAALGGLGGTCSACHKEHRVRQ